MRQKTLSLGFDTERPHGALAGTEQGKIFRRKQLAFIGKMNERFDQAGVPRTHFILTSYLEGCRDDVGQALLRETYRKDHPLQELQQHSHSHGFMEPLPGVNRPVLTAQEYTADLRRASELLEEILGVKPTGLRTPYGYESDLAHRPDILCGLCDIGLTYVSADLGRKDTLEGSFTAERQPHTYGHVGFPDLVEVPAHGLQDVAFTQEKAKQLFGKDQAPTAAEAFRHYKALLEQADRAQTERIFVALCLHPWAVMEYDPELDLLLRITDTARSKGFSLLSYGQVADAYRNH
jgi:hypothetical protein